MEISRGVLVVDYTCKDVSYWRFARVSSTEVQCISRWCCSKSITLPLIPQELHYKLARDVIE